MATRVYFLLAIMALMSLRNGEAKRPALCVDKPYLKDARKCLEDSSDPHAVFRCMFKITGIINKTGKIDADKMIKLIRPHVVEKRMDEADVYFAAVKSCAGKVKANKDEKKLFEAFWNCDEHARARHQYAYSVCEGITKKN